ncbi:MAG: hypothetical protein AAFR16_07845 [Pseudomonadota bacterium]
MIELPSAFFTLDVVAGVVAMAAALAAHALVRMSERRKTASQRKFREKAEQALKRSGW